MTHSSIPRPTEAELAILKVLWDRGPSTVREVHEAIVRARPLQYTTTLKLLQIMTDKGLTDRKIDGRSHIYAACQPREETQRRLVDDLLERAFGGSASTLVMQALDAKSTSPDELEEISRLIAERSKQKKE